MPTQKQLEGGLGAVELVPLVLQRFDLLHYLLGPPLVPIGFQVDAQ
ncbi:MAG: hypothetical protein GH143_00045, partial [Calditrichaeota bacterium]|nr:hypothetical protein [Calditrichota bacterium]